MPGCMFGGHMSRRIRLLPLYLLAVFVLAACMVPVAGGLDEGEANRIVTALDRAGIEATKEGDPAVEGKFRVTVVKDEAQRAILTMQSEDLPRVRSPGVLDAVDKGALVPSAAQEQAQLTVGTAGDLERTLEGVDGILTARVHLNVPPSDPLSGAPPPKTTASVLLEYRGATPPLTEASVARVVAGGVRGLAPADVAVVMIGRPAPPYSPGTDMGHVGPIAVAHASMRLLQISLGALVALVGALGIATLVLFSRVRRLVSEMAEDGTSAADGTSPALAERGRDSRPRRGQHQDEERERGA
jgi:type III secretion protein J